MLNRFDRHVLSRFLAATALLLVLLAVTFVVLDYVERVDDFIDRGATQREVFQTYYLHYLADIVRLTSPLAVFLAAIYVTARLAQSMQLTALHASGVSLFRYMRPLALAGVVIAGGMIAFNGFLVPRANRVVHTFQNQYYRDAPEDASSGDTYRQTAPGVFLAVGFYDRDETRAFRVSVITSDTSGARGLVSRLDASEMAWVDSLSTWQMREATIREFRPGGDRLTEHTVLDTALSVLPRDLAQSVRDTERLTIPEARAFVNSLERAGVRDRGRPLVDYHAKFSYPFANLILILLAVPLAAKRRRGGQAAQLGLGLAIAVVYLALQKMTEPLGWSETLSPIVAAWLPHAVFAVFAVVLLLASRR